MDAKEVVAMVVAGRARWGKSYGTGPFTADDILDALVELQNVGEDSADALQAELVKAKRQLTAALAREAKQKKQIAALKEELAQ